MNRVLGLVLLPLAWAQQGPTYDALKDMVADRTQGGGCPGNGEKFIVCGPNTGWDGTHCVVNTDVASFNDAAHNQKARMLMA